MAIRTPMMSSGRTASPSRAAAMATPKNGFRKWKVEARVLPMRPTSANQISVAARPGTKIW